MAGLATARFWGASASRQPAWQGDSHTDARMDEQPEPAIRLVDAALAEHLAVEFGEQGSRAVAFLQSAHDLLVDQLSLPSKGELVAYSVREALKSLLDAQAPAVRRRRTGTPSWSKLSRRVVQAHAAWEASGGEAARADDALKDLSVSINEMAEVHEQEDLNRLRLVAVLVDRTGGAPYGAGPQLIEEYATLLQDANRSLHGAVSVEESADYWARAVAVLETVFMPRPVRNQRLVSLAALAEPKETDLAELRKLIVVPGHFATFLETLKGPAWLPVLTDSGLLDPPTIQTWWPGQVAVTRLKDAFPAEVLALLEGVYSRTRRQPQAVYSIAWAAHGLGEMGKGLLLECLAHAPEGVTHLAIDQIRLTDPSDPYVDEVARLVLAPDVLASQPYLVPMLEALVNGTTEANARRRVSTLVRAIADLERDGGSQWSALKYERGISVATVRDRYSSEMPEKLLHSLTELISRSAPIVGVSVLQELIEPLTPGLRDRLVPWMLSLPSVNADVVVLLREVERGIASRLPTVDDIALIERAVSLGGQGRVDAAARTALGPPPTVSDIDPRRGTFHWPDNWRFRFNWSPLFSADASADWTETFSAMAERLGSATRDRIERRVMGEFVGARSPIAADQLSELSSEKLLATVRDWRPGTQDWLNSANELAEALVSVMKIDVPAFAADPARVCRELVHPTYIARYIEMLRQELGNYAPNPPGIVDAVNLVFDAPWEVEVIGGEAGWDYEDSWVGAQSAALELLQRLFQSDVDLGHGVEPLLERLSAYALEADPDYEPATAEPFERAFHHGPTVALRAVLAAAAWDLRTHGSARPMFAEFFSSCVSLSGATGDEMRAVLAVELPLLASISREWLDANFDAIFSTESDRGEQALDASLRWGPPANRVLESFPARVWNAVVREVERALEKVLQGMFWQASGYSVAEVVRRLKTMNRLSEAGETVGHLLQRSTDIPVEVIRTSLAFWDAALDARSDEALGGFGWYAAVDQMPIDSLAPRLARTLRSMDDPLQGSYQIAKRLGETEQTEDTLTVLDLMVRRQSHSFDQYLVMAAARSALAAATDLIATPEYQRLRNAVDERETT